MRDREVGVQDTIRGTRKTTLLGPPGPGEGGTCLVLAGL